MNKRYHTHNIHRLQAYDSNDLHKLLPNLMTQPRQESILHRWIEGIIILTGIVAAVVGTIQHWLH